VKAAKEEVADNFGRWYAVGDEMHQLVAIIHALNGISEFMVGAAYMVVLASLKELRSDMYTPVTEDQFEISDKGIKHKPTGCEFTPRPGDPHDGTRREGYRGSKLPSGEDYDIRALDSMMKRLWGEYVQKRGLDRA
jgi:hypothetical protein